MERRLRALVPKRNGSALLPIEDFLGSQAEGYEIALVWLGAFRSNSSPNATSF